MYLADTAPTEKKARYFVKKALALDPDNIEAKRQLVEIGAKSLDDILNGYKRIIFDFIEPKDEVDILFLPFKFVDEYFTEYKACIKTQSVACADQTSADNCTVL